MTLKYSLYFILASKAFIEFFSMDINLLCAPDCPLECDAVSYNSFMSHTDYPSKIYSSLLANNSEIIERYERPLKMSIVK